jgi:hypothetical protein
VAQRAAVLDAYRAMWVEQTRAYRKASPDGTDLAKHATLTALGKFRMDLRHMKKTDTVMRGELGHAPKVTGLDLRAKVPTATVQDCVDLSKWETVDTRTGKVLPLPTQQPLRYVATATVERWDGGRWMVTDYTPDGSRTC